MAFDDQIDDKLGSIKISEAFTDESLKIIQNLVGESAIKTLRLMMEPIGDAIRMNNFILHSTGQIRWSGDEIFFDEDAKANDIVLRLMMLDAEANARTVDLILKGTTGANSAAEFNSLPLADQELLYIELDRDEILNAANAGGAPASIIIENAVTGGSTTSGKTLKSAALTSNTGMPEMTATDSNSNTVNIPLVARFDWTDGIITGSFKDLWWIPHGIRWPELTASVVGAVVVKGFEAWPNTFVASTPQLVSALSGVSSNGGVILITENITVDETITIPKGVTLLARSSVQDGANPLQPAISMGPSGQIVMEDRSKMFDINIETDALFGDGSAGGKQLVLMSGDNAEIRDCSFQLDPSAGGAGGLAIGVKVTGSKNRIWNSKFRIQNISNHNGILYFSGVDNVDTDSIFDYTV